MAHYLVTGGAGFIGSHLVEELVSMGERVRVFDDFSTGKRENIEPWRDRIECIEGDTRDSQAVGAAMDGIDYVLHQAALPSVPRSVKDPVTTDAVNVGGTLNVLWAARRKKVKRVVFASSSSVYGNADVSPKHEELPLAPASPYAVSKLAGEHYCRVFHEVYGLETVSLRYFNVFGPRQEPDSAYAAVIPIFLREMTNGRPAPVDGDGTQTRDFTFVMNVVEANLLACTAAGAAGKAVNVGCGRSVSVLELVKGLNERLGTDVEPVFRPSREGDVKHSRADIALAAKLLGYTPTVGFEEGLARTAEGYGSG